MRRFHCDRCSSVVPFDASACPQCDAPLGYLVEQQVVRTVAPTSDPVRYTAPHHAGELWRCANAAWGCNWMLPAGEGAIWCRSCALTRGRPDDARPDAVTAWVTAEAAKRRLVHQLDSLGLPVEGRSPENPDGLAFDLVHLPGEMALTGHLDGVITLDLAESDDVHRETLRRLLKEPIRSVIGHLRHEIGHHYWHRLVGQSDHLMMFRRLFGDERTDYADALESHYDDAVEGDDWDPQLHVTAYASSHPLEDWAESFAHYLHLVDAIDTATAHGLLARSAFDDPAEGGSVHVPSFAELIELWTPIGAAVNDIAASLGAPAVYPFTPVGRVVDKLDFVHRRVIAHAARDRFYALC